MHDNEICHPWCCLPPASGHTGSLKAIVTWRERNQAQRLTPCLEGPGFQSLVSAHTKASNHSSLSYAHTRTHENPGPKSCSITATLQRSAVRGSGSSHKKTYWIQERLKHYEHSRFFHPWGHVKLISLLKNLPNIIISENSNEWLWSLCKLIDFYEVFTAIWMAIKPLQSKN